MSERIKGKTLIASDEGDIVNGVTIKLYGEETNGAISMIEQPFEPGLLLPPHVHQNDVWLMWNAGPEPARIMELYTPGGFELFFEDFGERLRHGPIGLDELNALGEPHGIHFFDDWIPDLKAAYGLRVIGE